MMPADAPFKVSEVAARTAGAEAAPSETRAGKRRTAASAKARTAEAGTGRNTFSGAAGIASAASACSHITFSALVTLLRAICFLAAFTSHRCAGAAWTSHAGTGSRHVLMDELGQCLEFIFTELAVAVRVKLLEHCFR
jgi:hypothetical protein